MFDVQQLLQTTLTDQLSTELINVPEGEYTAVATKIDGKQFTDKNNENRVTLKVTWDIDDPSGIVKSTTKRDKNTVQQTIFLDFTPGGALDTSEGRNVDLGRLRTALDQNAAGVPWSFQMIVGKAAKVLVKHRMNQEDGKVYAEVKQVGKLG